MKITTELLKKYASNTCSPKERQAVEHWLKDTAAEVPQVSDDQWERADGLMRIDIWKHVSSRKRPVVLSYKKWIRYAAAACVAAVIFFAGHYSATENISIIAQQTASKDSDNLLVYGGNRAYAKLQGHDFSLQFDGQLRLYNASKEIKKVTVGTKTYTLQPMQSYVLTGDNEKSSLMADIDFKLETVGLDKTKGDFGIRVLKA